MPISCKIANFECELGMFVVSNFNQTATNQPNLFSQTKPN